MHKTMRHVIAAVCVMSSVSCGDEGGGGLTINSYPLEFAHVYCTKIYACCEPREISEENKFFFSSEAECQSEYEDLYTNFGAGKREQDAGQLMFDAAAASAKLTVMRSASCATLFEEQPALGDARDGVYKGKVADGGDCEFDTVCAGLGSTCQSGQCTAQAKLGEQCSSSSDCVQGDTDQYCLEMKCVKRLPNGESCYRDDSCISGSCFEQKCSDPKTPGGSCDNNENCTSKICDQDLKTCDAPRANGAECFNDAQCMSGSCYSTLNTSACQPMPGPLCDGL